RAVAIADEDQLPAVGREGRLHVVALPAGDAGGLAAGDRQSVEIAEQLEHDRLAVRRQVERQPRRLRRGERQRAFGDERQPLVLHRVGGGLVVLRPRLRERRVRHNRDHGEQAQHTGGESGHGTSQFRRGRLYGCGRAGARRLLGFGLWAPGVGMEPRADREKMTERNVMAPLSRLTILIALALALRATIGTPAEAQKQITALAPQDIQWFTPAYYTDGRQRAHLRGDSSKGGDWIDRVRIPGGSRVLAHTHPDE